MTHTSSTTNSPGHTQNGIFTSVSSGISTCNLPTNRAVKYSRARMIRAMMKSAAVFALLLFGLSAHANNITLGTPSLTGENRSQGYVFVTFDLSWENSWRESTGAANWDAAWVFVKYRIPGGEWQHAKLHNTGHLAGAGTPAIVTAGLKNNVATFEPYLNPGVGVFIHRSTNGVGTFTNQSANLRWNYTANGIIDGASVEIRIFAIEMVYVREGAFNVGGGGGTNAFNSTTINTADATIEATGSGALGGAEGGYPAGQTAPANASWPNGYNAFYCMKYEVTQQQYVDFLNTMTQLQANNRRVYANSNRYSIIGSVVGNYSASLPYVACNYLRGEDGMAFADWSGLRPMTELEFEKACRGDQYPISGEYAWGTQYLVYDYNIANNTNNTHNDEYYYNYIYQYYELNNIGTSNEGIATNYDNFGLFGNVNCVTQINGMGYNSMYDSYDYYRFDLFNYRGPLRVGIFAANGLNNSRLTSGASYWGIMELSGNLWEFCIGSYFYAGGQGDGVLDSNGNNNEPNWFESLWRGGSWANYAASSQVSDRGGFFGNQMPQSSYTGNNLDKCGFRAVRN
jgi:formylglycine-generating enzyme required for sulfatase activity